MGGMPRRKIGIVIFLYKAGKSDAGRNGRKSRPAGRFALRKEPQGAQEGRNM